MHTEPLVSPLRVLVAGADPLVRRGLSQLLSEREAFEVLGPVGLGGGLASAIQLHRPDAVLVDPGPEIEPGAFETVGGVPVLVLATDADHAARALTMGARGALARDTEADRLGPALAAVERGLLVLDDRFAELWRRPAPAEGDFTLTARELEVLTPAVAALLGTRRDRGAPGSRGGGPGAPAVDELRLGGRWRPWDGAPTPLAAGDRVRVHTPGCGGWGPW